MGTLKLFKLKITKSILLLFNLYIYEFFDTYLGYSDALKSFELSYSLILVYKKQRIALSGTGIKHKGR